MLRALRRQLSASQRKSDGGQENQRKKQRRLVGTKPLSETFMPDFPKAVVALPKWISDMKINLH